MYVTCFKARFVTDQMILVKEDTNIWVNITTIVFNLIQRFIQLGIEFEKIIQSFYGLSNNE